MFVFPLRLGRMLMVVVPVEVSVMLLPRASVPLLPLRSLAMDNVALAMPIALLLGSPLRPPPPRNCSVPAEMLVAPV